MSDLGTVVSLLNSQLGISVFPDVPATDSPSTKTSASTKAIKTAEPDDGSGHESSDDDGSTSSTASKKSPTKASTSASAPAAVVAVTAQNAAIASDTNPSPTRPTRPTLAASSIMSSAVLATSVQISPANTNTIQAIASASSTSVEDTSTPTSVTTIPETFATVSSLPTTASTSASSTTLATSVLSSTSSSSSAASTSHPSIPIPLSSTAANSATPLPSTVDSSTRIPVAGIVVASAMGFLVLLTVIFLIFRYCGPVRRRYEDWQRRKKAARTYRSALDDSGVPLEKTMSNGSNVLSVPPKPIVHSDRRFYASEPTEPSTRTSEAQGTGLGLGNRLSLLMQHSPFQMGHRHTEVRQSQIGMAVSDPRYDRSLPPLPR